MASQDWNACPVSLLLKKIVYFCTLVLMFHKNLSMQRYILMFFLNGLGTSQIIASSNSRKGDFLAPVSGIVIAHPILNYVDSNSTTLYSFNMVVLPWAPVIYMK